MWNRCEFIPSDMTLVRHQGEIDEKRGVKRERERLKMREGGREGEGKRRENENEKLAK